jgi:F-type H+-transporting ATPase subunit gamma
MSNLKTLRLRIKSIKSTQKITKAMQMVAASKLRRARHALEDAAVYGNIVTKTLSSIAKHYEKELTNFERLMLRGSETHAKMVLAIVVTSERGLCGGFNQSILRNARDNIDKLKSHGTEVQIIVIGKKGNGFFSARYANDIIAHYPNPPITGLVTIESIYQKVLALLESCNFDECRIYFNHFKNSVTQIPRIKQLTPLTFDESIHHLVQDEYEGEGLVGALVKTYIASQIYEILLESRASEEAARMMAMDNATKNAGDMIQKLTLSMNRSRQATITKDLIEIISGAEAV